MAKTNEEILKLVEKNYKKVQVEELNVYDKTETLQKDFASSAKDLDKKYKATLKELDKDVTTITKNFAAKQTDIEAANQKLITELEAKKAVAKKTYEDSLLAAKQAEEKLVAQKDADIVTLQTAFEKDNKDRAKQLKKDIETAKKDIVAIQEKGVKDQATFDQKINDLKLKYEAKVDTLNEKRETKIAKLTDSSNKKVETLQQQIVTKREATDKAIATKEGVYEEELEEINEKITFEKDEYETKYANIKDSAEKRIAVREKHLQRALTDNDNRSAKQHKKDIAKFRKEADRDLVVLEKNYKQQSQVSADYRLKFMKEHYETLASMEKEFADFREQKQYEIDEQMVTLKNGIEQTKLEYENLLAEELNTFNNDYASIREKQESLRYQQDLDVEKLQHQQVLFNIEFERTNKLKEQELKEAIENKEKDKRQLEIDRKTKDALALNTQDEAHFKIQTEIDVAKVELSHKLTTNKLAEAMELHHIQDRRHKAQESDFLAFQQNLEPLYVEHAKAVLAYEKVELDNTLALKIAFYEKQKAVLEQDYKAFTEKIESTYQEEASFYEEKIEAIAGVDHEALQKYIEEQEALTIELRSKAERAEVRKDKRLAENELHNHIEQFEHEKAVKKQEIEMATAVFQRSLNDAKDRKEKALKDALDLYNTSVAHVAQAIDRVQHQAQNNLEAVKEAVTATEQSLNTFKLEVASRNQQHTDSNNDYLQARLKAEEAKQKEANSILEKSRELLREHLDQEIRELGVARQEIQQEKERLIQEQETNFEAFKNEIQQAQNAIRKETDQTITTQTEAYTKITTTINEKLNEELQLIQSTLSNQIDDYNTNKQDITKRINQANNLFETELKRIKKEFEDRLKEDYSKINQTMQEQINAIQ